MSEQQTTQQTNEQNPQNQPETPNNPATPESPNQPAPQQPPTATKSSSELEAENRALRAILSGHVEGINIDEELEFVGPSGKYRPAAAPNLPKEQAPEQRTSRRQGLQNPRSESAQTVDIAAIDKQFDNFLKTNYGFDIGGGNDD